MSHGVAELVGVSVGVGVFVGVTVLVEVTVGVGVTVSVGVTVLVGVTVFVGVTVGVGVKVLVGVGVTSGMIESEQIPTLEPEAPPLPDMVIEINGVEFVIMNFPPPLTKSGAVEPPIIVLPVIVT